VTDHGDDHDRPEERSHRENEVAGHFWTHPCQDSVSTLPGNPGDLQIEGPRP
jgi:hypothetical protein